MTKDTHTHDPMRALLLDPSRIMFRKSWYDRLLPHLARWGYNTVFMNMTDDVGCALEYHSHPALASAHAFSHTEMRRLVRRARTFGITMIPVLGTLGHAGCIFHRSAYQHLGDITLPHGRNVVCPSHPQTRVLLKDIIEETMDVFDGPWLHAGLDEIGPLPKQRCSRCSRRYGNVVRPHFGDDVFLDHVNWLHDVVRSAGRRMVMWNDYPLYNLKNNVKNAKKKAPRQGRVIEDLPKDIVMMVWVGTPDPFVERGYDVITTAYLTAGALVIPSGEALERIRKATDEWHHTPYGDKHLGICTCVWEHTFTLFGTSHFGIAYGGDRMRKPGGSRSFHSQFCRDYFGIGGRHRVGQLLKQLYEHALQKKDLPIVCLDAEDVAGLDKDHVCQAETLAAACGDIAAGLRRYRSRVTRNRPLFDAFILAADLMHDWGERAALLKRAADVMTGPAAAGNRPAGERKRLLRDLRRDLEKAARRARRITERALRNWDAGFYPDHLTRSSSATPDIDAPPFDIDNFPVFNLKSNKNVYYVIQRSTWYIDKLAREAETLTGNGKPRLSVLPTE